MKRIRIITCVLTAALIAVSFAGCGESAAKTSDSSVSEQQQSPQQQKASMAKVVSLDGDQLTVFLADMPDRKGGGQPGNGTPSAISDQQENGSAPSDGQTPPDGAPNGNTPPDGATPPDGGNGPSSASGGAIGNQDGKGGPGHGGGEITFSTEQSTYTLSDAVSVMKGNGDNASEIDLSDLKADDVIRFTTSTDSNGKEVIDSITVME